MWSSPVFLVPSQDWEPLQQTLWLLPTKCYFQVGAVLLCLSPTSPLFSLSKLPLPPVSQGGCEPLEGEVSCSPLYDCCPALSKAQSKCWVLRGWLVLGAAAHAGCKSWRALCPCTFSRQHCFLPLVMGRSCPSGLSLLVIWLSAQTNLQHLLRSGLKYSLLHMSQENINHLEMY